MESVTPGPIHRSTGVAVTPEGREMEQVIVTEPPASMVEEGEEIRVMLARSILTSGPVVTTLGSVLELATILMEYLAPAISPLITVLLSVFPAVNDFLSPPSVWL
jgi:hypothetical protein